QPREPVNGSCERLLTTWVRCPAGQTAFELHGYLAIAHRCGMLLHWRRCALNCRALSVEEGTVAVVAENAIDARRAQVGTETDHTACQAIGGVGFHFAQHQ